MLTVERFQDQIFWLGLSPAMIPSSMSSTLGSSLGYKSSNSHHAEALDGDDKSESFGVEMSTVGSA